MDMFLVALASASAAFPVLGVLWWVRDRADRSAAAGLDTVDIDPYLDFRPVGLPAAGVLDQRRRADRGRRVVLSGAVDIDGAVPLVWLVGRCWPRRRDRFAAYCRRLPAHPVERALSTEERDLLDRSWTWRSAYERAKDEESWVDSGGGF